MQVCVTLPISDIDALRNTARRRGITMTQTLKRAISMSDFIEKELERGSRLLEELPNGDVFIINIR